jgi:hypothetical protein
MEKGLRKQLVQISKDGYAKRKRLADALTDEELDYIKEFDKLATEFIEEMTAKIKEVMAGENDGSIHMDVDCGRIRLYTVPIHFTYACPASKYGKLSIHLRNFVLYLRDVEEMPCRQKDGQYILNI